LAYVRINGRGERRFTIEMIEEYVQARTVDLPKRVDKKDLQPLPYSRKGGDKEVVGVKDSGSLRKEIRNLCLS